MPRQMSPNAAARKSRVARNVARRFSALTHEMRATNSVRLHVAESHSPNGLICVSRPVPSGRVGHHSGNASRCGFSQAPSSRCRIDKVWRHQCRAREYKDIKALRCRQQSGRDSEETDSKGRDSEETDSKESCNSSRR
ncbi:hypothetical protein MRX96_005142 [Rhipicephalus microplus]